MNKLYSLLIGVNLVQMSIGLQTSQCENTTSFPGPLDPLRNNKEGIVLILGRVDTSSMYELMNIYVYKV